MMPVSAVLADDEIMLTIKPGEHGSTYGGNPIACKTAMTALQVLKEEKMAENAESMGEIITKRIKRTPFKTYHYHTWQGPTECYHYSASNTEAAWELCLALKENGLLAKPTHGTGYDLHLRLSLLKNKSSNV